MKLVAVAAITILVVSCAPEYTPTAQVAVVTRAVTATPQIAIVTATQPSTDTPTSTATTTVTPTTTATPTSTATPTQVPKVAIPGLNPSEYPTVDQVDSAKRPYASALNIPVEAIQLVSRKLQSGIVVLVAQDKTSLSGTPLLIMHKNSAGALEWRTETITFLLAERGIKFGFTYDLQNNPYRKIVRPPDSLVVRHSTIVSPEDAFYWPFIFQQNGRTTWSGVDEYISFFRNNGIESASPHIFWPGGGYWSSNPDTLVNNISQIVSHCKSDIHSWTINELFNEDGTMKDKNGPELAINAVRAVDPNAQIVINEFGLEYLPVKEDKFYEYVASLKKKGTLKDGDAIGLQGHDGIAFNKLAADIEALAEKHLELGLKVRFTELDVFDVKSDSAQAQAAKASVYSKFFTAALDLNRKYGTPVVDAIIVWGSTENSSWLRDIDRPDEYPLLLNDDGTPELTYYLIAKEILQNIQ